MVAAAAAPLDQPLDQHQQRVHVATGPEVLEGLKKANRACNCDFHEMNGLFTPSSRSDE